MASIGHMIKGRLRVLVTTALTIFPIFQSIPNDLFLLKKQPRQPTYHRHMVQKKYHSTPLSNPILLSPQERKQKEKRKKTPPQKTPQPTYSPNQLIYSVTSLNLTLFSGSAVAGFALTFNGGHISPFAVVLFTGSSLGGGFENTTSPTIHTSAVLYF